MSSDPSTLPTRRPSPRWPVVVLVIGIALMPAAGLAAATPFRWVGEARTAPLLVGILGNTSTLALGTARPLVANATGGIPPYGYQWYATGPNGSSQPIGTTAMVQFRPFSNGVFTINVTATDQSGNRSGSSVFILVGGQSPVSIHLTSDAIANGLDLTAAVTGGTPPYWFRWSGPGIDPNRTRASSIHLADLPSGTYLVGVSVADASGYSTSTSVRVVVNNSAPTPLWIDLAIGIGIGIAVSLPIVWYEARQKRNNQKADSLPRVEGWSARGSRSDLPSRG